MAKKTEKTDLTMVLAWIAGLKISEAVLSTKRRRRMMMMMMMIRKN